MMNMNDLIPKIGLKSELSANAQSTFSEFGATYNCSLYIKNGTRAHFMYKDFGTFDTEPGSWQLFFSLKYDI